MAGDAFRHVTSGDKVPHSARLWNTLIDLARERDLGSTGVGGLPAFGRDADVVKVKNVTNANQPQFAVLGLDVPLISPTDNLGEFQRRVTFGGVVPLSTNHAGKFCVLQEPLGINSIGTALVSGVTPVNLNTLNTNALTRAFADVANGNTAVLLAANTGGAQILWAANTNSNTDWGVVRLGGGSGGAIVPGTATNVALVSNVNCNGNTLTVTTKTLSATVLINGVNCAVSFLLT